MEFRKTAVWRTKLIPDPKLKLPEPFHEVNVTATQIYTHVMQKPGLGVKSPVDLI
jgi:hypothetical protein